MEGDDTGASKRKQRAGLCKSTLTVLPSSVWSITLSSVGRPGFSSSAAISEKQDRLHEEEEQRTVH